MGLVQSYFFHDSNARNDEKILAVRMKYGLEGYGIYFCILERLRDCRTYMSVKDYNMIAFDLRVPAEKVKSVVEDFGLFEFSEDRKLFYSERFLRQMKIKDDLAEKSRKNGSKGGRPRKNKDEMNPEREFQDEEKPRKNPVGYFSKPRENLSKVKESNINISAAAEITRAREEPPPPKRAAAAATGKKATAIRGIPPDEEDIYAPEAREAFERYWNFLKTERPDMFGKILQPLPTQLGQFCRTLQQVGQPDFFDKVVSHLRDHPKNAFSTGKFTPKLMTLFGAEFPSNILTGFYDKDFSQEKPRSQPQNTPVGYKTCSRDYSDEEGYL